MCMAYTSVTTYVVYTRSMIWMRTRCTQRTCTHKLILVGMQAQEPTRLPLARALRGDQQQTQPCRSLASPDLSIPPRPLYKETAHAHATPLFHTPTPTHSPTHSPTYPARTGMSRTSPRRLRVLPVLPPPPRGLAPLSSPRPSRIPRSRAWDGMTGAIRD